MTQIISLIKKLQKLHFTRKLLGKLHFTASLYGNILLTFVHHSLDSSLTGPVHVASKGRILDKFIIIDGRLHLGFGHKVVSNSILLSGSWRPEQKSLIYLPGKI